MTTPVSNDGALDWSALKAPASPSTASTGLDKDAFLKLLVAQLRYQDPGKPLDSAEYMSQMAQFTQVEKLASLEKAQAEISAWQRTVAGEGMVGKTVTGHSSTGADVTGVVTGLVLGTAGPQLVLADGTQVAVDAVESVGATSTSTSGTSTAP